MLSNREISNELPIIKEGDDVPDTVHDEFSSGEGSNGDA